MFETIKKDLIQAMKDQEKFKLDVIRMLKSALSNEQIEKHHELTDEEVIAVIKREVKKRSTSIEEYQKYGKDEVVNNLNKEIEILKAYLPEEMSEEEISKVIDEVIADLGATSIKEIGSVMKEITSRIGNCADMSIASKIVREKLM